MHKDRMIDTALDIYHTYDVTMEEAMDIAFQEDQKSAAVEEALDIYHTYDVSMEEAMSMALEGILGTAAATSAGAEILDKAHAYTPGTTNVNLYSRTPATQNDYHDLVPGAQRALMQGILKWIDDYNLLPEGKAKTGVGNKICKAINDPIVRNLMMKSGYWDKVPPEVRAMQLAKHAAKYDKAGYKAERKDMKYDYKRDKKARKQEAKTAKKAAKLAAKRAAWEAACATADDILVNYPTLTNNEAIEMAMQELGYTYDDIDFGSDYYDYED